MEYVIDTHPLVWSLFAQHRLSTHTRDIFQQTELGAHRIVVPAIVVAELIMVVEKRRVSATLPELFVSLTSLQGSSSYQFLPLLPETVINSHTLTAIPDIFDRLIVAEALRLGLPLITRDATIAGVGLVRTVWD